VLGGCGESYEGVWRKLERCSEGWAGSASKVQKGVDRVRKGYGGSVRMVLAKTCSVRKIRWPNHLLTPVLTLTREVVPDRSCN
jgi:hypothetical protein